MRSRTWWSRWAMAAVVAGALLIGTVFGPAVVQAATAGLVRLEGGGNSHVAKVSSSGQLSVNPGLAQTAAHQILAVPASPSSFVTAFANTHTPDCSAGGFYQIPRGHALIITSADFAQGPLASSSPPEDEGIAYGPPATPCTFIAAFSASDATLGSENQVFEPGIAVPAGDALGLYGSNDDGGALVYGYLVPASEVPQHPAGARPRLSSFPRMFKR
jgi:hypothetical protein